MVGSVISEHLSRQIKSNKALSYSGQRSIITYAGTITWNEIKSSVIECMSFFKKSSFLFLSCILGLCNRAFRNAEGFVFGMFYYSLDLG